MHRVVAGIAPAAPGYREIVFRPRPGGGLSWAQARHETPYGLAAIAWELADGGALTVNVTVPHGTRATLDLPGEPVRPLEPGTHRVVVPARLPA
jgi:alpha-L-rhamnosidase